MLIDPKVQKKYLNSENVLMVMVHISPAQNHDEVLKHLPHYRVTTLAGYGVYFPLYWTHIVYTEPGLNIMTKWRQPAEIPDAFTRPHSFPKKLFFAGASFLGE